MYFHELICYSIHKSTQPEMIMESMSIPRQFDDFDIESISI